MSAVRLSPSASITPTSAGVLLRSDLGTFQITGPDLGTFLTALVPLLDGTRDEGAIAEALPRYSPASIARFLAVLTERGLLEEVPAEARRDRHAGQRAFFRRWPEGDGAMDRIAAARVLRAGDEAWGAIAARELGAAGVGAVERFDGVVRDPERSLILAAVAPDDARAIEHLARAAHDAHVRIFWSHLAGGRAVLGPLTVPGRTACRVCAACEAVNPPLGVEPPRGARAASMAQTLGHLVALVALEILGEYTLTNLGGRVVVQDLATFETTLHTLVRLPWCPVCAR